MAQKTDVPGIYKMTEGVLINKDNDALKAYKLKKQKDRKINEIEEVVVSLRDDINEIKQILKGLTR